MEQDNLAKTMIIINVMERAKNVTNGDILF